MDTPGKMARALVTGAARGIGRASARALARRGHAVALIDRLEPELEATVRELTAEGLDVRGEVVDVADFRRVQEAGARLLRDWGPIGVLVLISGCDWRVAVIGMMVAANRTATTMKPVMPPAAAMMRKGPAIAPSLAMT